MKNSAEGRGKRLLLAGATAIVSLRAAQEAQPTFDVASIKRDVSSEPDTLTRVIPVLHFERATLKFLVTMAYQVHDFQVIGGPGWIDSDRYNIDAKAEPPPAVNMDYRDLQLRRLQTLLRDRFNLTLHRETKELPVYELTVAKGGPKLQPPNCIQREPGDTTVAPGKTPWDYCGLIGGGGIGGGLQATSTTLSRFADFLSFRLGRAVVDKTGITGEFQIQLTYAPDTPAAPGDGAAAADLGPDFFTAMREQLGLKLESAKGPVEILVIDHVERPSEN